MENRSSSTRCYCRVHTCDSNHDSPLMQYAFLCLNRLVLDLEDCLVQSTDSTQEFLMPETREGTKVASFCYWCMTLPPLLMFSAASANLGVMVIYVITEHLACVSHCGNCRYALPKFTQLTVTSYYTASRASHYGVSLLTRHIEEDRLSRIQHKELRR